MSFLHTGTIYGKTSSLTVIKCWICTKTFWQNSARKQVWNKWLHIFKVERVSCVLCESDHKYYHECRKASFFFFFFLIFNSTISAWKAKKKKLYFLPSWHHLWVTEFFKLNFWGEKKQLMQEMFFFWTFISDGLFSICLCTHTHMHIPIY